MKKLHIAFLVAFIYLFLGISPAVAATSTPPTGTLQYEYWPTENGGNTNEGLTIASLNGTVYDPLFMFISSSTISVSSICLAIDSYGATDPTVKLGVYTMENDRSAKSLMGYSDPYPFLGQTIDWYTAGEQTCFSFSNQITLTNGVQYAIGVDIRNNTTKNEDIWWYNRDRIKDTSVWFSSASVMPGLTIPSDDKPYMRIYGEKVLDPVVIIPGILGSWEKNGQWVLDPILHTYDNLIDTFLANGYVEGKTLFKFPYDWEQPNEVTALQLKNKITEIKTICGCAKVDLVGHSMGGLIATYYIESDDYQNDVDQLFLVATPLSGTPKAYKAWEGGDIDFGRPTVNTFLKIIFYTEAFKNGYGSIFDYIHSKPIVSIQELLPVNSNYLKTNSAALIYPTGYPNNLFLERLTQNFIWLTYRGVHVKNYSCRH